nr:MAG TPA: hypothetical protein [Caudoviricetes sp.]
MHIKHARTLTIYWAPGEGIDLHTLATTLRKLPPATRAYSIETTQDSDSTSFNVLRIEYIIDEATGPRRIINEHQNLDTMQAFADITREARNLPTRD